MKQTQRILLLLVMITPTMLSAFELGSIGVPASEPECVRLAAADLASDVQKITGKLPVVDATGDVLLISLNRPESAALLEKVAPGFGDELKGKWEAYRVETIGGRLIIAGSDERGTMFGLYAFIEKYLGVDPLWYWSQRPPAKRATLAWDSVKLSAGEPTFRYRGWFINDEDLLSEFRLDGGERKISYKHYHHVISPAVSARIFEAALRLQMNLIIPSSLIDIRNPAEARLIEDATRRGLFVSMHHIEPVGVSAFTFENFWKEHGTTVPFQFTQQRDKFAEIWREYIGRWAKFRPIWQLGLRGIGDRPVWQADPGMPKSDEGRGKVISDAMAMQWDMIRQVDPHPVATTTLWMEGTALHAAGHLKFPAGVSVIFSDNSPGWELQEDFRSVKREAGRPYGVYYHQQLWNSGPHLVQVVSPQKTQAIFRQVVRAGATNYALVNAGNVREFVLGLDATARMLRDFPSFDSDRFLADWCAARFGAQAKPAEAAYRQLFASFVADSGKHAMLDGECMKAAAQGGKASKIQREKLEAAGAKAEEIAAGLTGAEREFFESNFMAQQKIMLGLLCWNEAAAAKNVAGMKDALALIEAGKALASRGEFKDWYRGDRKMNLEQLKEWTTK